MANKVKLEIDANLDPAKRSMDQFRQAAVKTGNQIDQTGKRVTTSFKSMALAGGALLGASVGIGALGALAKGAISTFAEFEQSIARAGAVSNATQFELERLSDAAREMGRTTQFSAAQAAEGLTFLSMAGFAVTESVAALPGVLQLAAAAQIELGAAADIASNILSGFGLEVSELARVNDILTNTFTTSNTSLLQLGEGMKFVAPIASAAGISIEEVAAAMGILGTAGIQGSLAGTALRSIIVRLIKPVGEAADVIEKLGIETRDSNGELLSLADILDQLETAGATASDAIAIFGVEAGPALLQLLKETGDGLREYTEAVKKVGTTAEVATKQNDTLAGAWQRAKSASQELSITVVDKLEPSLKSLAEGLAEEINRTAVLFGSIERLERALRKESEALEESSMLTDDVTRSTIVAAAALNEYSVSVGQITELENNRAAASRGVFAAISKLRKEQEELATLNEAKLTPIIVQQTRAMLDYKREVTALEVEMRQLSGSILAQAGALGLEDQLLGFVNQAIGQYNDKTIDAARAVELLKQGLDAINQSYQANRREIEQNIRALERLQSLQNQAVGPGDQPGVALPLLMEIFEGIAQNAELGGAAVNIIRDEQGNILGSSTITNSAGQQTTFDLFQQFVNDLTQAGAIGVDALFEAIRHFENFFGFAHGGIVPGPVGRPTPAIVHGGESIFTPEQMAAGAGPGGIGGITLVLNISNSQIGIGDFDKHVVTLIRDTHLAGGLDFLN